MSSAAMVRLLSLLVVVSVHSFSLYRETHKDVEKITFTCIPYHATGLLSLEALEYIVEPCFKVRLQELGIFSWDNCTDLPIYIPTIKNLKNVVLFWESSGVGLCVLSTCMHWCDLGFTLAEVDQAIQSIFLESPPSTR